MALYIRQLTADIPVGRLGTTDDVATLVALLASPRAGYITVTTIQIDGGQRRSVL